MGYHKAGINLAVLDTFEQRLQVTMDMRLPHTHREALGECGTDWHLVQTPRHTRRDRNGAPFAASLDGLTKTLTNGPSPERSRFLSVITGIDRITVRLQSHRIDTSIGPHAASDFIAAHRNNEVW